MKRLLLCLPFLLFVLANKAQERQPVIKLSQQGANYLAFTHARIVTAPGQQLEDATLIVRDGVIEAVGAGLALPAGATELDMKGKWIYPAFIEAYSQYGSPSPAQARRERGAGRRSPQYNSDVAGPYHWNEAIRPHSAWLDKAEEDPAKLRELRSAGFALLNTIPIDGIMRGAGALLETGEGPAASNLVNPRSCAAMSFNKGSSQQAYPSSLMGSISLLRQTFADARWYAEAQARYAENPAQPKPAQNLSLEALNRQRSEGLPILFDTESWQHLLRAAALATEAQQPMIYKTAGDDYKRIESIKALKARLILPLNFPEGYDVSDPVAAREISLEQMRHWAAAPHNPAIVAAAGIPFALSATGLKKPGELFSRVRQAMQAGLTEAQALAAFTTAPAQLLGISQMAGSLEKGKRAHFLVASGKIFDEGSTLYDVYVAGKRHEVNPLPGTDFRGTYNLDLGGKKWLLEVSGNANAPEASLREPKSKSPVKLSWQQSGDLAIFSYTLPGQALTRVRASRKDDVLSGTAEQNSKRSAFSATLQSAATPGEKPAKTAESLPAPVVSFPNKAYGLKEQPKAETVLFRNATLWTNSAQGVLQKADLLIENGKIRAVGQNLPAPEGAAIVDASGRHISPGIIDEHSHIAISGGVNEGTHSASAEVRINDVIDVEDIDIYRQLAGGVTAAQLLHGSANPIGGQSAIIKLRWGALPEEMVLQGAPGFIKFALGENVKQSNWGEDSNIRYPQTRMGVEQIMRDLFQSAKDYRAAQQRAAATPGMVPPKPDFQLETLLEILDGKRFITCHSYVQSEILMLIRLAEQEGFRVNTFTHGLEAYKVADKLKAHGANASIFADWWAYKMEVYEAIPYNAAILHSQGVNVCINSDDAEMARRLNQEAAKTVKYGGVSEEDALKMVTLNPAKALHIDHLVGSLEAGKDADIVLWSEHPLSVYARPLRTYVDGRRYFDAERDREMQLEVAAERSELISRMMQRGGAKRPAAEGASAKHYYHCEDMHSEYNQE